MNKSNLSSKLNSNGHKKFDASITTEKTEIIEKSVRRNSAAGKVASKDEDEKSMPESDQLTLRAWKKTFENRNKAA